MPPYARSFVFAAACGLLLAGPVRAQDFQPIQHNLPALQNAAVDAADVTGDGHPDLLLSGLQGNGVPHVAIYAFDEEQQFPQRDGSIVYVAVYDEEPVLFQPVVDGVVRWVDYDGDGDFDALLAGLILENGEWRRSAILYRRDGDIFFRETNALLVAVSDPAADWGDYDGDGDLDLLLAGDTGTGLATRVYRNDGAGRFTLVEAGLPGVMAGSVAWGDYDGDGDLDVLLTGRVGSTLVAGVYRNDGGTFVDAGAPLRGVYEGTADWGDYDGDGDLDVVLAGSVLDPRILGGITRVYRNDGGAFVELALPLPDAMDGAAWADYDSDGDVDLVITGSPRLFEQSILSLYANDGAGSFTPDIETLGAERSTLLLFDYLNDGDLDVLSLGTGIAPGTGGRVVLIRNND